MPAHERESESEDSSALSWLDATSDFARPNPLTPLFDELWSDRFMGKHSDRDGDGIADQAQGESRARTANEEDRSDVRLFRGARAEPPVDPRTEVR